MRTVPRRDRQFRRIWIQPSSLTTGSCQALCAEHSSRTRNRAPGIPGLAWEAEIGNKSTARSTTVLGCIEEEQRKVLR